MEFIEREAECSDSDKENDQGPTKPTSSDQEFIDDSVRSSSGSDPSFYRKFNQAPLQELGNNSKDKRTGIKRLCVICKKEVSLKNFSRHKNACLQNYFQCKCPTGSHEVCDEWVPVKDKEKHVKTHTHRICKICDECVPKTDDEHEVNCRLRDIRKKSLKQTAESWDKDYENYLKWLITNGKKGKRTKMDWLMNIKKIQGEELEFARRWYPQDPPPLKKGIKRPASKSTSRGPPKKKSVPPGGITTINPPQRKSDGSEEGAKRRKKRKKRNVPASCFTFTFSWGIKYTIFKYLLKLNNGYNFSFPRRQNPPALPLSDLLPLPGALASIRDRRAPVERRRLRRRKLRGWKLVSYPRSGGRSTYLIKNKYHWPYPRRRRNVRISGIQLFREIMLTQERGIDGRTHVHGFIRLRMKLPYNTVRRFFYKFKTGPRGKRVSALTEFSSCKRPPQYLKYTSKEDADLCEFKLDKEKLHQNYIMVYLARKQLPWRPTEYHVKRWGNDFAVKKYQELYDYYKDLNLKERIFQQQQPYANMTVVERMRQTSCKGILLHGVPGTCKSSTAIVFMESDYFQVTEEIRFMFHSYRDQKYIYFEDFSKHKLQKRRTIINQLTDHIGVTQGERKGAGQFPVTCQKVIITSNDDPPSEEEWGFGFERRFLVVNMNLEMLASMIVPGVLPDLLNE